MASVSALADENTQHVITIKNTDQNVVHSYEAYQVFVGKLDDTQTKLSDVQWGNGVNDETLLVALKSDTAYGNLFTDCTTAAQVAEVLGKAPFVSTAQADASAGAIDAIASIISKHLVRGAGVNFTNSGTDYEASVTGDGYYFVKDTTTTLTGENGSDTLSKYLLSVVKNVEINAKDTVLFDSGTFPKG